MGELLFKNNIPLTSKGDNIYHGFGINSIKMIVDKYDGYMTIDHNNDKFILSILIKDPKEDLWRENTK